MPVKRPSDFVAADRIEEMTSPTALRIALHRAETRVAEADLIGWPALAESWRGDVRRILARMAELKIPQAKRRRFAAVPTQRAHAREDAEAGRKAEELVTA